MHVQAVFIPFIFVRMEEKGKILIIDDNKDVLFALNLLLEPYMQKVKVTTQPARIEYFMRTFQTGRGLAGYEFPSGCRERAGGF